MGVPVSAAPMSDDYDDADFEEEDFQESPEVNTLGRYEEIVFCPDCDVYMPYKVDGAIVRRQCPNCKKLFEGGQEVTAGSPARAAPSHTSTTSAAPARRASGGGAQQAVETEVMLCAATTKAGTPCQNPPRAGSKYCSSHRGWRPPRK